MELKRKRYQFVRAMVALAVEVIAVLVCHLQVLILWKQWFSATSSDSDILKKFEEHLTEDEFLKLEPSQAMLWEAGLCFILCIYFAPFSLDKSAWLVKVSAIKFL